MEKIKKFGSYLSSKEELSNYLCRVCGVDMKELQGKSELELQAMCRAYGKESANESKEELSSKEDMCKYLCRVCGLDMKELKDKSELELQAMCRSYGKQSANESKEELSSREDMCKYLCRVCGLDMKDLQDKSELELQAMCRNYSKESTNESKGEKWIQDAIKKPGALRKQMGKKEGEKLSASEINAELKQLKSKDKDKSKEGVQGLSKSDLTKYRRLNLAKTLKGLKEHQETENYMFFGNLKTIKRLVDELLEMDESKIDSILSDGHNWALDHIATSKDDIEEVFNFLAGHEMSEEKEHYHSEPSHEETEGNLAHKDLESEIKGIKSFKDFK